MYKYIRRCLGAGLVMLAFSLSGTVRAITLDEVITQAVARSYDLQIAHKDIEINKSDLKITRSEYLPTIQPRINIEYLKDLEQNARPVVAVGNTVIPSGTRYQNSLGVNISQTLLDFGIRRRKMDYTRQSVLAAQAGYEQAIRDLKLKLVDFYTEALLNYRAIQANNAILDLAQQGYQMKKRLYTAGSGSNVEVATEAIQVAQTRDDLETLRQQLEKNLDELSYYTQESYPIDTAEVADLPSEEAPETVVPLNTEHSPEARQFDAKIQMKQREIEILKRQYLPQISFYSYYNLYGFDSEQWLRSLQNISQRTVSAGLSVILPSFDGLKHEGLLHKAKLEKERLALEKAKALAELKHRAETLSQQADTHGVLLKTKATIVNRTQDKLTMEIRLSEKQLIDKTQAIQDHIERIRRQLDAEKALILQTSALIKLRIMEANA